MIFVYLKRAKLSKMRYFTLKFTNSFRKISYLTCSILLTSLLLASCSSTQSTSTYTYLDDIYNPGVTVPVFNNYEEPGEPPANVPGAAYVYQPIPEPSLNTPSTTYPSGTLPADYNQVDPYVMYDPYFAAYPGNSYLWSPMVNGSFGMLGMGYNSFYNPFGSFG